VHGLATAGAGFLLAVLWFDLMFDVQVLPHRGKEIPEPVVASIAGYYRRVTTESRPMNRLVAAAMVATIVAVVVEAVRGTDPDWVGWLSVGLVVAPVGLAAARTVPSAVRLGSRRDTLGQQAALARAICGQHLFCVGSIAALLVLQL
jgi:hypothetical protein